MIGWLADNHSLLGIFDLGTAVLELLAVVGGAAVGGFGSGLLLRLIVRLTLHQSVPRKLVALVQVLGALVLGLLVWLLVTGAPGKGLGWGGGGGSWFGGPGGEDKASTSPENKPEPKKSEPTPPQKEEAIPAGAELVRVQVLGGDVPAERFYLVGDDPKPKNRAELDQFLQTQKRQVDRPPLRGIEIVLNENSVPREHAAVAALEKLARQYDLAVTFPKGNPR